jgi:hypothetical protein
MFSPMASGFCYPQNGKPTSVPASLSWSILQPWISNDMDPKLVSLQYDTEAQDAAGGGGGLLSQTHCVSQAPWRPFLILQGLMGLRHRNVPCCIDTPASPQVLNKWMNTDKTCFEPAASSSVFFFYYYLIGIVGGGVQLGPLGTAATNRPIVPAPGDHDDSEIAGMIGRGNRSTRRKPAPVPLCSPETPHVARTRTRTTAVGSQRLTAWATA